MSDMMTDAALAAHLADAAGRNLVQVRDSGLLTAEELGKAGDHTPNQFLIYALAHHRPDDGLLSEESKDTGDRLSKSRVWIIDPVDGTREYGEGRTHLAVPVALAIDGVATVGAVALPGLGLVLRTDQPCAAPPAANLPSMVASRTRPAKEALSVAQSLGAELVPMGSAGAKTFIGNSC